MPTYQRHIERAIRERPADHPVWRYNDKHSARQLQALSGIRAPALLAGPCSVRDLEPPTDPAALKPIHGCSSRGVHLLVPKGEGVYEELLTERTLTWDEVVASALAAKHRSSIRPGHPDAIRPPWLLEELLINDGHVAYDWKFFVIGAEPVVVLQMLRLPTGVRVKWWDATSWEPVGNIAPARSWHFDATMPLPMDTEALNRAAHDVAKHVESPFVRVDLYEADGDPVFGEITPIPTGGSVRFVPAWDEHLGSLWDAVVEES